MIEVHDDGSVTVSLWNHPRTLKQHMRSDCKAMRTHPFDRSEILDFPTMDDARRWFQDRCGDESTCAWCFPRPPLRAADEAAVEDEAPDTL